MTDDGVSPDVRPDGYFIRRRGSWNFDRHRTPDRQAAGAGAGAGSDIPPAPSPLKAPGPPATAAAPADWDAVVESLARGFAGCDYLQGLARADRMVRGIPEEARGAFAVALTRRLARAEHCTPALLNLTGDLKLTSAEPVLLSHALSDGFWPGDGSGPDTYCGWPPDRRAALTGALAKLGCARIAPVLRREMARRSKGSRWWRFWKPLHGEMTIVNGGMGEEEARAHRSTLETLA